MGDLDKSSEPFQNSPEQGKNHWASFREIGTLMRLQWPKYLVDIVVIILGISISFMLDSRKEEAGRSASEQVYLKSLLSDINSDLDELQDVISTTKNVIDRGNAILLLTAEPNKPITDYDQFSNDFKDIVARPNFVSKDATFSDLKSSGNMQLLSDTKLKSALFDYYRLYESIKAVEVSERETVNTLIAPYLMKRFSIKGLATHDKGLDSKNRLSFLKKGVDIRDILAETEFSNAVVLRIISRKELLEGYEQESNLAQKIKTKLEQD